MRSVQKHAKVEVLPENLGFFLKGIELLALPFLFPDHSSLEQRPEAIL